MLSGVGDRFQRIRRDSVSNHFHFVAFRDANFGLVICLIGVAILPVYVVHREIFTRITSGQA